MGEQPVFSTRAHVFQIDPTTKKSWVPCSKQAVTVSFYYDPTKETHRIISVDGTKAIINSTVFPNMNFTKTSQKFGQWSDPKVNSVYGLGFPSETELNKFAEKFKEARGSTKSISSSSLASVSSSGSSSPQSPIPSNSIANNTAHINGMNDSPTPQPGHKTASIKSGSSTGSIEFVKRRSVELDPNQIIMTASRKTSLPASFRLTPQDDTREHPGISHKPVGNTEAQLKYENDRLKMALAQSSGNAKKWETELQTLKNNNARLTAALQESTANVEEWKKQLNAYKEESNRLRKKVQELESSDMTADVFNSMQQEKMALEGRIIHLESIVTDKDKETTLIKQANVDLNRQLKDCRILNDILQQRVNELEERLSQTMITEHTKQELSTLQQNLTARLQEMSTLNDRLSALIQD